MRHRLWSIEDPPLADLNKEGQLRGYRRIRDALSMHIASELRLPERFLRMLPQRK